MAGLATASAPRSHAAIRRHGLPAVFSPSRAVASASLRAVAATSTRNAWAVGTPILHWDGHRWSIQRGAKTPRCHIQFWGVTARSPGAAWAVGTCAGGSREKAIIQHWDGRRWTVQPSPSVPGVSELLGIKAISRSAAWAVGAYQPHASPEPLIEHWNGHAWKLQHAASAGPHGAILTAVTAVSANDAWAVGYALSASPAVTSTLIEHWNGHSWKVQPSFSPGSQTNLLYGVAATSGKLAWATGLYTSPGLANTLAEGWHGTMWLVQSTENPRPECFLYGVAARSASDVWAVGSYGNATTGPQRTLVERWNGHSWKIQASPS